MSLRTFHFVFILAGIVLTDMFGAWAVWRHTSQPEPALLWAGILSFAIGFGLIGYAIWLVRKLERTKLN